MEGPEKDKTALFNHLSLRIGKPIQVRKKLSLQSGTLQYVSISSSSLILTLSGEDITLRWSDEMSITAVSPDGESFQVLYPRK